MITLTPDELKALIKQFGDPTVNNEKGGISRLNDIFWAALFARTREKIILEYDERSFYDYDPETGIYLPKSSDKIRVELNALILETARTWNTFYGLQAFRNTTHLNGPITQLRGLVEERNFFNNQEYLVHLANCTLRFNQDGEYRREDFSQDHRCRNRSPLSYHPDAKCRSFEEKLLSHVSPDDRIIIQKYAGQCLLGRNLMNRFLILDGVSSSSKSTLALVLNGLVGQDNSYELRTQHLNDRFEIGRMIGRTLLIGPDVRGDFLNLPSASRLKALVGGDRMDAELKRSNGVFPIYGTFNLVITSNSRLHIHLEEDSGAWRRRLLIARYETPFRGDRIFEIHKHLLAQEGPGIINFCLEGLQMLLSDRKKHKGDIFIPESQEKRIDDLLNESDSLRIFVTTHIIRDDSKTKDEESWSLTTDEIVTEYWSDCIQNKNWTPLSKAEAEKQLPDLMLRYFNTTKSNDVFRGSQKRGFWHVKFNYDATSTTSVSSFF
jgi:putative DNA primase/helicase